MDKVGGIYKITCTANNKVYIGLSSNLEQRIKAHISKLTHGTHTNKHLQAAWDLYGENSFTFDIIEYCDDVNMLKEREIFYISKYKSDNREYGFNNTAGGDGLNYCTDEVREKLSISKTKKSVVRFDLYGNYIDEYRNVMFATKAVNGNYASIRACCDKRSGYKTSSNSIWMYKDDYLQNGLDLSQYKNMQGIACSKEVIQYDKNGNYIATFESAHDVERKIGISFKLVSAVCTGAKSVSHGYVFRYKGDPFNKYAVKDNIQKSVDQFDLDGNLVKTYESIAQASRDLNVNGTAISKAVNNKCKTGYGYIWKLHDECVLSEI